MIKSRPAVLFTVFMIVVICDTGVGARTRRKPGTNGKENRSRHAVVSRESAAREYLDRLDNSLSRLSYAMDDYDFNKIHWHLFDIYECYAKLDTLSGAEQKRVTDSTLSIVTPRRARMIRTQAFIDSFITTMEQKQAADTAKRADTSAAVVRPVVMRENDSTAHKLMRVKNGFFEPLKNLKRDSMTTILLETEIASAPRNYVEYEVAKLKEKTAALHRYFDAGEFSMSRTELEWLIDYLSGVKTDIINYIAFRKDVYSDGTHSEE